MMDYDWTKTKKRSIQAFRKGKLCITFESLTEAQSVGIPRPTIRNSILSGESIKKGRWKGYRFRYRYPERFAMEMRVREIKLRQEREGLKVLIKELDEWDRLYPNED